jgi:hypothetical protein
MRIRENEAITPIVDQAQLLARISFTIKIGDNKPSYFNAKSEISPSRFGLHFFFTPSIIRNYSLMNLRRHSAQAIIPATTGQCTVFHLPQMCQDNSHSHHSFDEDTLTSSFFHFFFFQNFFLSYSRHSPWPTSMLMLTR